MLKPKTWLPRANKFIKDYALMLLLLVGGGYFLLGNSDVVYYAESRLSNLSEVSSFRAESIMSDASVPEPMSMMGRAKSAVSGSLFVPEAQAQGFDPEALNDRKIIKNGSLQLEVENTAESLTLVQAELANQEAYTTHQNSWEVRRGILAYNITIRVPAEKLETLSANLEKLGVKKSENYSTSDITAQYQDTANRIKNLEVRRERLRELMGRETEDVKDILEVDRELTRVQTDIDNYTSTQRQRDTDVTYSTLQLTLNPEPEIGDFSNPDWNLENSWKVAVNDFMHDARGIVDKLIRIGVYTLIWLPILLVLWGLKRWLFGGKKKKK